MHSRPRRRLLSTAARTLCGFFAGSDYLLAPQISGQRENTRLTALSAGSFGEFRLSERRIKRNTGISGRPAGNGLRTLFSLRERNSAADWRTGVNLAALLGPGGSAAFSPQTAARPAHYLRRSRGS